jgi:hypothetical protein
MQQYNRLTGQITRLLVLLLLSLAVAGCTSTRVEEAQIAADAQATTAQAEANAKIQVAATQADATKYTAAQQAEASKYESSQATQRVGMWAGVAPTVLVILAVAALLGIVLWYRGKAHVIRVTGQVALLSPPSAQASPMLPLHPAPPLQVTVEAERMGAVVQPGAAAGEWLLLLADGQRLLMRPRQAQLDGPLGGVS